MTLKFVEHWLSYANGAGDTDQNGWFSDDVDYVVASADPRIAGGKYMNFPSGSGVFSRGVPGVATYFLNFSFLCWNTRTGLVYFLDSAVQHVAIVWNHTDSLIYVYRGNASGTQIAVSTLTVSKDDWHHIECKVTIDNTVGVVIVNIDGVEYINFSGDTQNAGTANINTIQFVGPSNTTSPGINKYLGQVFIFDTAGSFWNDFQGDIACVAMPPTSDVTPNQFTPSTGTDHYAMVDEVVPDGDTTYLESSTDAQQCLFAPDALAANISELLGVVLENVSKKTDIDDNQISNYLKVSTTSTVSTPTGLTTDYTYSRNIYESNPDTAVAWALADWTNISFGFENTVP